jgi:1-acyl-sn-glycerol-3-phosphate acyltransferase
MHPSGVNTSLIVPAEYSERVARVFLWWVRRMFRSSFAAVRVLGDTAAVLRRLDAERGPAIVVMNHQSWWDPLTGLLVSSLLTPSRRVVGPMQADQLRKFGIFRKLGVFGIEPDDPASLEEMIRYLGWSFAHDGRGVLWITPQGQFADPRVPVRIRPGVASAAARLLGGAWRGRVVSMAVEMPFWTDKRPELLLRFQVVECGEEPRPSTADWTRAITRAMRENAEALATGVMARDPTAFETIFGGAAGRINPLYDLWLRLRGRSGALDARDRGMARGGMGDAGGSPARSGEETG